MAAVEQPCYTIINSPVDSEPYNEMQLKSELGELNNTFAAVALTCCFRRKGRCEAQDRSAQEDHQHDSCWRTASGRLDDYHSLCASAAGSYHQEAAADLLGNCAKNVSGWKVTAGK